MNLKLPEGIDTRLDMVIHLERDKEYSHGFGVMDFMNQLAQTDHLDIPVLEAPKILRCGMQIRQERQSSANFERNANTNALVGGLGPIDPLLRTS